MEPYKFLAILFEQRFVEGIVDSLPPSPLFRELRIQNSKLHRMSRVKSLAIAKRVQASRSKKKKVKIEAEFYRALSRQLHLVRSLATRGFMAWKRVEEPELTKEELLDWKKEYDQLMASSIQTLVSKGKALTGTVLGKKKKTKKGKKKRERQKILSATTSGIPA